MTSFGRAVQLASVFFEGALCAGAVGGCLPEQRPVVSTAAPRPTASTAPSVVATAVALAPLAPPPTPNVQAPILDAHCFDCADDRVTLHDGWQLQASAKVKATGKELSLAEYVATDWYAVSVPSTVLAGLVKNGVYPDPYQANNLSAIPAAPFAGSYWYRTQFNVPFDFEGQATWLNFDGLNYRANLWLNGKLIASSQDLVGTFTSHEWNISQYLRPGQPNALAVEVFPPDLKKDLALSWLDWNPTPPDRDMGIFRDVYLKRSGPVAVRGTHVLSKVDTTTLDSAELTIKCELRNTSDQPAHTQLEARIAPAVSGTDSPPIRVTQDVDLQPYETRSVAFDAARFPALLIKKPRLWWPAQLGAPNLYDLRLSASGAGRVSDVQPLRFGIRQVSFEPMPNGARVFRINGKRIMIRGGGWASDMLLRSDDARLETELAIFKDLGLNTIRLEGKLETDDFYAKTDAYGILTLPGWMCCDEWQESKSWSKPLHEIGKASMASQAQRLRNHPSVIDFLIGSDEAPAPSVEREFLAELQKADWPVAITPSASDRTTAALGRSGMKMTGPYDWVPPGYWYQDQKYGGGFGFNSETSPGPAIPELETLREWLTPEDLQALWSKPKARLFHAGTQATRFESLSVFNEALAKRFGKPSSLEDYVLKAQVMNYEAERVMFEAYARNKYQTSSGVVHWMLNNSWPSLIWHLYAHDFSTAGGYFGAKKANEAVHIQYSYDDRSIVVVNHTQEATQGLTAAVRVYDSASQERFALDFPLAVAADSSAKLLALPDIERLTDVYFVKLSLLKGTSVVSSNWYWLSRKAETMDFRRTDWDNTPTTAFADFTPLAHLAPATVRARILDKDSKPNALRVELQNTSPVIAFFVRLELTHGEGGAPILPALWQDNYLCLLPGEKREIEVSNANAADLRGAAPAVAVSGWNVARASATAFGAARLETLPSLSRARSLVSVSK